MPGPSDPAQTAPADTSPVSAATAEQEDIDGILADLAEASDRWAELSLRSRADLIDEVHSATADAAEQWVQAACGIKGIGPDSAYAGEEWMTGPYAMLAGTGVLAGTLAKLADGESPLTGDKVGSAPGDRVTVKAVPRGLKEKVLMHGFRADVWLRPGVTAEQARSSAGLRQLTPTESGGVGVVLGAGNITSIAPLDVLYELVAFNRVVVLKMNPVLDDLGPALSAALGPLIREGYVHIVHGGAETGSYLTSHEGISHVHITGSAATHDAIVWGHGDDAAARKSAGTPQLQVPISSELGGVSPVIIVPGTWSNADLRYQAEHVATMRLHNSGHNCVAGQVVILSSDWEQKEQFLGELRAAMERITPRPVWYPHAEDRLAEAGNDYPDHRSFGDSTRILVDRADNTLETTEYFAPVLGVTELPGTGEVFFEAAVEHANARLTGTLGANILVDPRTRRFLGKRFDELLVDLHYGTIAVNAWTGFGFLTAAAGWGAYPGGSITDIQSGVGTVHNALLLDGIERTVVQGPFRPFPRSVLGGEFALFPKPPWFVTSRTARQAGRALSGFAAGPRWVKLPGIFFHAFRG